MHWLLTQTIWLAFLIAAGPSPEYTVLVTRGEVTVKTGWRIRNLDAGDRIGKRQLISVGQGGFVSLIDDDDKRVDLSKKGDYPYKKIEELFKKSEKSLYTRLLANYTSLMTKPKEKKVAVAGAVFRGDEGAYSPGDSTIVLDNTITFRFENEFSEKLQLIIRDAHTEKLITQRSTTADSLVLPVDFGPGHFLWQISDEESVKSVSFLIIPNTDERLSIESDYMKITSEMTSWPDDISKNVMAEWKKNRKILWNKS